MMFEHVDIDRVKQAVDEAVHDAGRLGERNDTRMVLTVKAAVMNALSKCIMLGWAPENYLRADTRRSPEDPRRLDVRVTRNLRDFPMGFDDYEEMFGQPPRLGDLERLNCQQGGQPCHLMCGYCVWCGERRWKCDCPFEEVG
jgi:hypothetical protein